uniref:Uncharacterized protein n=1 Tax=Arundo donax TaxID=35708 RepID=A0A0A9GK63_ARUDO
MCSVSCLLNTTAISAVIPNMDAFEVDSWYYGLWNTI